MQIIVFILFIFWIYVIFVFRRGNLHFFKFCFGSIGLFFFLMFWCEPLLIGYLTKAVTAVAGIAGNISGLYDAYYQYGLLFIPKSTTTVSLYIDYECSGVIEIMAFSSMLWFFPLYNLLEKLIINLIGALVIFGANILRIFLICVLIYYFGNDIFYFAHTIFGRMIFYVFSVVLYFYVFTRSHIIRQKVGQFSYGDVKGRK